MRQSRRISDLHLRYKQETGNDPIEEEVRIGVVRMRGLWVLDPDEINDDDVLSIFGRGGELILVYPDQTYVEWLEDQIQ